MITFTCVTSAGTKSYSNYKSTSSQFLDILSKFSLRDLYVLVLDDLLHLLWRETVPQDLVGVLRAGAIGQLLFAIRQVKYVEVMGVVETAHAFTSAS